MPIFEVENRRRFPTSKTDMADEDDNKAVASTLFISVVASRDKRIENVIEM